MLNDEELNCNTLFGAIVPKMLPEKQEELSIAHTYLKQSKPVGHMMSKDYPTWDKLAQRVIYHLYTFHPAAMITTSHVLCY